MAWFSARFGSTSAHIKFSKKKGRERENGVFVCVRACASVVIVVSGRLNGKEMEMVTVYNTLCVCVHVLLLRLSWGF